MAMAEKTPEDEEFRPLTEEELRALNERARREIPKLRRQFEEAMAGLERIASGEWRRDWRRRRRSTRA